MKHIINGITPELIRTELFGANHQANPVTSDKDIWKKWLEVQRDTRKVLPAYYDVLGTGQAMHYE